MYVDNNLLIVEKAPISRTSVLMSSHPVALVTTVGRVNGKAIPGVAVIATCLDTSYRPPYVSFSTAVLQHLVGEPKGARRQHTNTYLNVRQNGSFVVNLPGVSLVSKMDILAYPYRRKEYRDKIEAAGLTKVNPFELSCHGLYPPLIAECLAHLECEVVDIHRPKGSDHYTVTGRVVACSYACSLDPMWSERLRTTWDDVRKNLAERTWHHFGRSEQGGERFVLTGQAKRIPTKLRFHLEQGK